MKNYFRIKNKKNTCKIHNLFISQNKPLPSVHAMLVPKYLSAVKLTMAAQ